MISDSNRALCPECGAPCTLSWSGLDLVENTGDETLATKHYEFFYGDVDKLKEALKQAKEVIERTIVGHEWRIDNDPMSLDKSDYEHIDEMRQALETINKLGL